MLLPPVLNLAYHEVKPLGQQRPNSIVCTPERLEAEIVYLKSAGYQVLACREFVSEYLRGKLPHRVATLTFDDGFRCAHDMVLEILSRHNVRATFFVIGCTLRGSVPYVIKFQQLLARLAELGSVDRYLLEALQRRGVPHWRLFDEETFRTGEMYANESPEVRRAKAIMNRLMPPALAREVVDELFLETFGGSAEKTLLRSFFLNRRMLAKMTLAGMEIASHSMNHPFLPLVSGHELEQELVESRALLGRFGRPVETFGWPFGGEFSLAAQATVQKYFKSSWNYGAKPAMPQPPYNLTDIPRMDEKYLEVVLEIPPLA